MGESFLAEQFRQIVHDLWEAQKGINIRYISATIIGIFFCNLGNIYLLNILLTLDQSVNSCVVWFSKKTENFICPVFTPGSFDSNKKWIWGGWFVPPMQKSFENLLYLFGLQRRKIIQFTFILMQGVISWMKILQYMVIPPTFMYHWMKIHFYSAVALLISVFLVIPDAQRCVVPHNKALGRCFWCNLETQLLICPPLFSWHKRQLK